MARSVFGDLVIDVIQEPGTVRLSWHGRSNHREPDVVLGDFFAATAARAQGSHATVDMHFEDLEFFNSSTITSIIRYVKDLRGRGIPLRLTYNPRHRWQKIFFDALWVFDKGDGMFSIHQAGQGGSQPP